MAQTLQTLSIISFAVAGVCLVLAIFFWFFFKIPTVIGDLSGRTARKSIAKMRAANEKTGAKSYKESKTNAERGKLTGTMPDSGKLKKKITASDDGKPETGLLAENKADGSSVRIFLRRTCQHQRSKGHHHERMQCFLRYHHLRAHFPSGKNNHKDRHCMYSRICRSNHC